MAIIGRMRKYVIPGAIALGIGICPASAISANSDLVPIPKTVIYPGDIINDDMLVDTDPARCAGSSNDAVRDRAQILGKAAQQTLLPGRFIPATAIASPRLVRYGSEVELVYIDGGLLILATGSALQEGRLGDMVKVRNSETGLTVTGVVQADGRVRVKG